MAIYISQQTLPIALLLTTAEIISAMSLTI